MLVSWENGASLQQRCESLQPLHIQAYPVQEDGLSIGLSSSMANVLEKITIILRSLGARKGGELSLGVKMTVGQILGTF